MLGYRLQKGMYLRLRGREYIIEQRLPNDYLQVKDLATNEFTSLPEPMLIKALFDGDLELLGDQLPVLSSPRRVSQAVNTDLSLLDDSLKKKTQNRYAYISEIKAQGLTSFTQKTLEPVIEAVKQKINDAEPPSWVTLYRWYRRYNAHDEDIRSLIPASTLRGNRYRKFSGGDAEKAATTTQIINTVIAERYLSMNRPTVTDICDAVKARIAATNQFRDASDQLAYPHRNSIYSIVNQLDPYVVTKARFGKRIADQKYATNQQGPRPTRPLERVELDHTKLDLFVVDEELKLPVGRPWMTTAIDSYTKMIVGMYIGFTPPSFLSVMQCLCHAIKPKTYVKELYPNIENSWDAYGIPETIVVDNAPEFYSTHFEDACLQLGINIHYAPPKRGQYKGAVERWFRTQNQQLLHSKPGTTFSNIIDRADYDPQKNAVISYALLNQLAHMFIIDVYHQNKHRGICDVPARLWKHAIAEFPPALPPRHTALEASTAKNRLTKPRSSGGRKARMKKNEIEIADTDPIDESGISLNGWEADYNLPGCQHE